MKFRTPATYKSNMTPAPSGSKYENEYGTKLDEQGHRTVYIKGQTNIYEKIQADLESTLIENILEACTVTGDYSALERKKAEYMDCTEYPENLIEAQNIILKEKENFERLPLEIRRKYNHSFTEYLADMGSETWAKNMGFIKDEPKTEPKTEPKEPTEGGKIDE
ncbi:minor capsid protein [Capybara microvirus Cap3_SP_433]|nr:minor capsid protein [Capybara microvirus Cap3_SP_433]